MTPGPREAIALLNLGEFAYDNKDTIRAGVSCIKGGGCDDLKSKLKDAANEVASRGESYLLGKLLEQAFPGVDSSIVADVSRPSSPLSDAEIEIIDRGTGLSRRHSKTRSHRLASDPTGRKRNRNSVEEHREERMI